MKKYTYQQILDIIEKKGRYSQCVPLVEIMLSIERETGKVQNWGDTAPYWVSELFAHGAKSFLYCGTDGVIMLEDHKYKR